MKKYCAFLRGVNIGKSVMKMTDVKNAFENAGMKEVSTILATGNILFSTEKSSADLKKILEKSMSEYFNYEAFLFIKNKREIQEILENNPFENKPDFHIYAFVGIDDIEKVLMKEFEKCNLLENEKAKISGNNFYWQIEKGNTLNSEFGKILGRKDLKNTFTSRNINTFEKIYLKLEVRSISDNRQPTNNQQPK